MLPSKIYSGAIVGLDASLVEVETDVSFGLRSFEIVGLPDQAIEESKERIGAALKNSGFRSPHSQPIRVLVNLAPADLKKEGTIYDLPIAMSFLIASRQVQWDCSRTLIVGELSLNGALRPIKGALSFSLLAKQRRFRELILPKANAKEACLALRSASELKIVGAEHLREIASYLSRKLSIDSPPILKEPSRESDFSYELSLIQGQEYAKRAIEIACAGFHNLFLYGPPGTGKTMLAKAAASILPPLDFDESLEVTKIYSVNGLLDEHLPFVSRAPFRNPHHTSSEVALIGGGNPPRAGEITFAHRGILFLDEFPEFHRDVLESLRQPLEEGSITLLRSKHRIALPAAFMLICASNPCPCGYYRNSEKTCLCSNSSIQKYRRKLSGPLMDRIDMFVEVPQITYQRLAAPITDAQLTERVRHRVANARTIQKERFGKSSANSRMSPLDIKKHCALDAQSENLMKKVVDSGTLSARGYHRVLKTARTIADLEKSQTITFSHVSEALSYRIRGENS